MRGIEARPGERAFIGGWGGAAALAMLAAAYLLGRSVPSNDEQPWLETQDASVAGLAGEQADRGREAGSPGEIPARGWQDIVARVYGNVGDHRILALAAGMTY